MNSNLSIIKNQLDNLVDQIRSGNLIEKSDIIEKIQNISTEIDLDIKKNKPIPKINSPTNLLNLEIEKNYSDDINKFIHEKENNQINLINKHENNLLSIPVQHSSNNDPIHQIQQIIFNSNEPDYKQNDIEEEVFWSPILSDSNYIQMKKYK